MRLWAYEFSPSFRGSKPKSPAEARHASLLCLSELVVQELRHSRAGHGSCTLFLLSAMSTLGKEQGFTRQTSLLWQLSARQPGASPPCSPDGQLGGAHCCSRYLQRQRSQSYHQPDGQRHPEQK